MMGSGASPTPSGDQRSARKSKPVVTLSVSSSFVAHWLISRLGEFDAAFPQVDLRFDLVAGVLRDVPDNVDIATQIVAEDESAIIVGRLLRKSSCRYAAPPTFVPAENWITTAMAQIMSSCG